MKIENNPFLYTKSPQVNFEAIKMKQISPEYQNFKRMLETELDTFAKNGENADIIGKGLSAVVYGMKNFKEIVFKKSLSKQTDFADEIRHLKLLPDINTVQRFVGQAFDDETGIFYLLTTRMNGKPANPQTNPYTREHLKNLFGTFFELDKNGIYHGDFNLGNILLDSTGKANLIDFQWMQKVEEKRFFENKPKILLPPFILSENSQMFEMASLPFYIKNAVNRKAFFKQYLQEKAVYHENRAEYIKKLLPNWKFKDEKPVILKGLNFENAQSVLFRHPDSDILKIEAEKLQFLTSFREAFSRQDKNNPESNFTIALSSHLKVLSILKNMRKEISKTAKQKYLSNAKKDYLEATDEYAKYWFDNIKSWTDGMFKADVREAVHINEVPANIEASSEMTDIITLLDGRYKALPDDIFDIKNGTDALNIIRNIKNSNNSLKSMSFKMLFDVKFSQKHAEIKKIDDKISKAVQKGNGYEVINLSILNIVKNRELKKIITNKPNLKNKDDIITELHNGRLLYEDLARQCYKYILNITERS